MSENASSAFISYSRDDSEFALRLAQDLKAAGADVWLDQLDIRPGHPWDNAIEDALNDAPQMLVILSPASSKSPNVRDEIDFALRAGKIVVPILYVDCAIPLRLGRTQRIDFRADYARGLAHLLAHLRVTNPDPAVLQRAAEADAQRQAAWQAREAEAQRLRETPERQRDDAERKAREEEQLRLQQAREVQQREAEPAALQDKQRKAEQKAAEYRKKMIRWSIIGGSAAVVFVAVMVYFLVPRPPKPSPIKPAVNPPASAVSLYQQAVDASNGNDWTGSLALLQQSCSQGYSQGCMTEGYRYETGAGTKANQFQAVTLYQAACDAGNAVGCDHLANHYMTGSGVATGRNLTLARQTYQKSCTLGDQSSCGALKDPKLQPSAPGSSTPSPPAVPANVKTAYAQADADFNRKDYQDAAPLYQQSCDFGEAYACTTLGFMYSAGEGVSKNPQMAVTDYRKACNAGDSMGCRNLGNHLRDGDGAPKDTQQAIVVFQNACDGGDSVSCRNLAILYDAGTAVAQDLGKAKQYYQKGCTLQDQTSCDTLKNSKFQ